MSSPERVATEPWVLLATILASSMSFISAGALNVALPALQADLNVAGAELLWIINANQLLLSALILVGGSLGDHYGRKRVFRTGVIVFSLANLICGLAPTSEILIAARALQGIGGALMVPGSLAIITAVFPADRRGRAIGTWSTFSAVTTAFGPILGGWLAGQGLWRAVFFINLPLAVVVLFALRRVPESRDEDAPKELDYIGALLATLGLSGITYGFIQAPDYGFSDPRILVGLIGGGAALVAFVVNEIRSDHPMVPLGLFKSRTFSGSNMLTLFLYAALNIVLFFLPLNLIQVQGYPEETAALAMLPFTLLLTVMSRWAGGLIDRVGSRLPLTIGPLIVGVGYALMALPALTTGPSAYWTTYFPGIFVIGIGMGITVAPLTTTVMGSAPDSQSGTASGINNTVSRSAGVLAIAILGSVALLSFSSGLETRADDLRLSDNVQAGIQNEARKLADADVPPALIEEVLAGYENPIQLYLVRSAISRAFVETFRQVVLIGAVLAWLSALMAFIMIEPYHRMIADKDST